MDSGEVTLSKKGQTPFFARSAYTPRSEIVLQGAPANSVFENPGKIRDNDPLPRVAKERTLSGVGPLLGRPTSLGPPQRSVEFLFQALDQSLAQWEQSQKHDPVLIAVEDFGSSVPPLGNVVGNPGTTIRLPLGICGYSVK
jgi:hypothetical protein